MTVAHIRNLLAALALILCSACTELDREAKRGTQSAPSRSFAATPTRKPAYWKGDSAKGAAEVVIHLKEQRAYFFKGGKVVGESNVSTGRKGFETPPGRYHVIQKDEKHLSNLYGS